MEKNKEEEEKSSAAKPQEEEKSKPGDRKCEKMKLKQMKRKAIMENSNLLLDRTDLKLALLKQIEFYFSDSNLYRDQFLSNILQQAQEVDTSVVLNFPRVQSLLSELKDYDAKLEFTKSALSGSSLVALSEDLRKIRRKKSFSREDYKKTQVDLRTIYVENLPSKITHESLAAIFAKTGKINHISLPKFLQSKLPKGFAFVEFEVLSWLIKLCRLQKWRMRHCRN